jgi:hypothetical protein
MARSSVAAPAASLAAAPSSSPQMVALSVLAYSLCSGTLLLLNKAVMLLIPSAPLVTSLQCAFCVAAVGGGALAFGAPRVGPLPAEMVRAYALYTVLFVLGIYSNMRSLAASNVDTVIVFRAAVPLAVAAGDFVWLGRAAPSARSLAAMVVVLAGCAAFVAVDAEFAVNGLAAYFWVSIYYLCIAAEMLFGKQITSKHNASLAASVLLTNALGLVPFLAIGASTGELARGKFARAQLLSLLRARDVARCSLCSFARSPPSARRAPLSRRNLLRRPRRGALHARGVCGAPRFLRALCWNRLFVVVVPLACLGNVVHNDWRSQQARNGRLEYSSLGQAFVPARHSLSPRLPRRRRLLRAGAAARAAGGLCEARGRGA